MVSGPSFVLVLAALTICTPCSGRLAPCPQSAAADPAANTNAVPAPVLVTVFDAGSAPAGSFALACPGLSRFHVPAPTRATLPRGLTARAFRQATVLGVRVTVNGAKVQGARQLPGIAGVGLHVVNTGKE